MLLERLEIDTLEQLADKARELLHVERERERQSLARGVKEEILLAKTRGLITEEAQTQLALLLHASVYG